MNFKDMKDDELIKLSKVTYYNAFVSDTYSCKDLLTWYSIEEELERRGYAIKVIEYIEVTKTKDE